jgi:16S rRNA (guanine1207-N2)-methyltransferase
VGGSERSHYFSERPGSPSRRSSVRLVLPDLTLDLATDRGVFGAAARAVDPGTKLLLTEAASVPPGAVDVCDLGCGYGPIAVTLARRAPEATVWAVDVNERARALAVENAAAAGVADRVRVCTPGDVPASVRFAALWSNPPIRIGKGALHELLRTWLARVDARGASWLVVHKHLGADSLASWLVSSDWRVERVRSRMGYRILRVARDG